MREYLAKIESDLSDVQNDSVKDYLKEADNFVELNSQISACDEILHTMENLLSGFQADLGNISSEIKTLRDQSTSMNAKLRNRQQVHTKLEDFVDFALVPQALSKNICLAEVNEDYLGYLVLLNKKLQFVADSGDVDTPWRKDIEPQLRRLCNKAVEKAREYLLRHIYALDKPSYYEKTPLLKFHYIYYFLSQHANSTAVDIKESYTTTMNKIYTSHFKNYIAGLIRLIESVAGRSDLLGIPEGTQTSSIVSFWSKSVSRHANVFALGKREEVLDDSKKSPIVLHVAVKNNEKYPYEIIFSEFNRIFMDHVTYEWRFDNEFFKEQVKNQQTCDLFGPVFGKTVQILTSEVSRFLAGCYDSIGILLMLRILYKFRVMMKKTRKIRVNGVTEYFDSIEALLWPRFQSVIQENANSLKNSPILKEKIETLQPHYMTRRYAEFVAAIHYLNIPLRGLVVPKCLGILRTEMRALLQLLRKKIGKEGNETIFLINNYDLVLSVLQERGIKDGDDFVYFQKQLEEEIATFWNMELQRHYGPLLKFITTIRDNDDFDHSKVAEKDVQQMVSAFSETYVDVINKIRSEAMVHFSNFRMGARILKQILLQLNAMYNEFDEVLRKYYPKLTKVLIARPVFTHHIEKYMDTFD